MPKFGTKEYLSKAKSKAKKINVDVKYSKEGNKKLDVIKDGKKVGSIGHKKYSDHIQHGEEDRRQRYLKRHSKEPKMKDGKRTNSYYADKILW
tara:strand:+ start:755 stop:1033 length:279 start_codon:yes stop_codon:yes gene_type:complete